MAAQLKVKDFFAAALSVDDAFLIAGPRPAITSLRESLQSNLGIALNPGEMAASSPVSFEAGARCMLSRFPKSISPAQILPIPLL